MACAKNTSVTNFNSNDINSKPQYSQNLQRNNQEYIQNSCRKISSSYPSFSPTINFLSTTSSQVDKYSLVFISGSNFLPSIYGTTYVNFGTIYKNIPIIFYSTSQIAFVVPLDAVIGIYEVVVVNVYNGNFSPSVNTSYSGNLNYSNSLKYTIY
jgi:hypothetical protein